jgi:RNA polymerase sigma factor (sigma-70 family)
MNGGNHEQEKTGRMSPTDNELMEQVRDGTVEKLAVLFERHQAMLYNFFLRLTGNRATSEDLVQEVFIRILKYRAGYLGESRFVVWMFQIARNAHVDFLRRRKAEVPLDEHAAEAPSREPPSSAGPWTGCPRRKGSSSSSSASRTSSSGRSPSSSTARWGRSRSRSTGRSRTSAGSTSSSREGKPHELR